jgi:hypothetical protein
MTLCGPHSPRYEGIVDTFVQLLLPPISSDMSSSIRIRSGRRDESSKEGRRDGGATQWIASNWGNRDGVNIGSLTMTHCEIQQQRGITE